MLTFYVILYNAIKWATAIPFSCDITVALMKFVIQFFLLFPRWYFSIFLFFFHRYLFLFCAPYSIFLYNNSFYVVYFNMIYLPDYLNSYLNLFCFVFYFHILLCFSSSNIFFSISLRSFFVELLGITTFILKIIF